MYSPVILFFYYLCTYIYSIGVSASVLAVLKEIVWQRSNIESLENKLLGFFRSQENNVLLFVEFVREITEIGHSVDREKCLRNKL